MPPRSLKASPRRRARMWPRYSADFDALYQRLERFPESGSPRPALGRLVRIGVIWPYTVIREYIAADDVVTIMRVVQGRRRMMRRMLHRPAKRP